MKEVAILDYMIMFDPNESWSNGYQFENQLADFFAANGFEAQIVEARGGSGKRVIMLTPLEFVNLPEQKDKGKEAVTQIKQIAQKTPPKDYKKFREPRHEEIKPPKLAYQVPGRILRKKVRLP